MTAMLAVIGGGAVLYFLLYGVVQYFSKKEDSQKESK